MQSARKQLSRAKRLGMINDLDQARYQHKKFRAKYVREIRHSKIIS